MLHDVIANGHHCRAKIFAKEPASPPLPPVTSTTLPDKAITVGKDLIVMKAHLSFRRQRRIMPNSGGIDLPLSLGEVHQLFFNQRID